MNIDRRLREVAETDRFAVEVQTQIQSARARFVTLLPQFMAIRADGNDKERHDAEQLIPQVLRTLDYIDSCLEQARNVRADMAQLHHELTLEKDGRDYVVPDE